MFAEYFKYNFILLTCDNTGDFGHETFDSSDGHALLFILDESDNVFNLQKREDREERQGDMVK